MTQITLTNQTVYLLVGPSGAGKSTFTENLIDWADRNLLNVTHLSSDNFRFSLRHSEAKNFSYMDVSEQAFNLLFSHLEATLSFPAFLYNNIVVVDTTGLDKNFRDKVVELVKYHNYRLEVVIFYYGNNVKNYLTESDLNNSKQVNITTKHISKLKYQLKYIGSKDFDAKYIISSKGEYTFKISGNKETGFHVPNTDVEPLIIGDIHGQFNALVELVEQYLSTDGDRKVIILVGDYIDKNTDINILKTIDYIYSLLSRDNVRLYIVRGNHEERVYKQLIKGELLDGEYAKYYSTLPLLLKPENKETADKFKYLYDNWTFSYVRYNPQSFRNSEYRDVIVVHSPCKLRYVAKETPKALKHQLKAHYPKKESPLDELIPYVKGDSFPIIVWGHTSVKKATRVNNRVFLDSGACRGNLLTGYLPYSNKFIEVPCESTDYPGDLIDIDIDYIKMSETLELPDRFKGNLPIRYVSPTMSPVNKSETCLEDINEGFKYYFSQKYTDPKLGNIDRVIVQLKYMGSRLQAYYYRTDTVPESPYVYPTNTGYMYFVTRGGYLVAKNYKDLTPICATVEGLAEKYSADSLIVDGELLPWSFFAQGLIDDTFLNYYETVRTNLIFKQKVLDESCEQQLQLLEVYKKELDTYSKNVPVTYHPFDILSINEEAFTGFPICDNQVVVTSEEFENGTYVDKLKSLNPHNVPIEGYVIKPYYKELEVTYAPYLKARTEKYLTLVYGYDYNTPYKLPGFLGNKTIKSKVALSIDQYNVANKLLQLKDYDTRLAMYYYSKLLDLEDKVSKLDPRL